MRIVEITDEEKIKYSWQNLLCMYLTSKCENMFWRNQISEFFQFICLGLLALLFIYCVIKRGRKYCIRITAYFPNLPNLISEKSKKSFFRKMKRRTYWRIPKFNSFLRNIYKSNHRGEVFCKTQCSLKIRKLHRKPPAVSLQLF